MAKRIIRLCYRKIIDGSSQKLWDKYVFDSTYQEFLMQSQFYNQEKKYTAFSDLLINVPGADKLHFLVSAAITGYMQQLNGKVPDIMDNLGKQVLVFKDYRFEIINSDSKNKAAHQIAVNFFSEPVIWHDIAGNYLLISAHGATITEDGVLTNMLALQPFLSIYSIKEE